MGPCHVLRAPGRGGPGPSSLPSASGTSFLVAVAVLVVGDPALASPVSVQERAGECRAEAGVVVCWEADPGLAGLTRRVLAEGSWMRSLPGLGPPGRLLPDTLHVWVVEDLEWAARRAAGAGDDRARRQGGDEAPAVEPWVAGFAIPERALVVAGPQEAERGPGALARLLRHELAHLALARIANGRAPRWLHEGYAQLAEGSWGWDRAWTLRLAFLRGEGPSLSQLSLDFPRQAPAARLAYLLSYTAVSEMASLAGDAGLRAFFARLEAGADVDQAMRRTFGLTLAQFEDRWRRTVGDRYGWLYLLTRAGLFWIVISALLIFAYWNRRRHDRQRMEELRAREALEERSVWSREEEPVPGESPWPGPGRRPGPPRSPERNG